MLGCTVESNQQDFELHWTARNTPGGRIVQAFGQVDAHNEAGWQRMLAESTAATPPASVLVIDCAALDFMSCGALVALAKQSVDSRQQGITVRLVIGLRSIRRIITECGLDDSISAYPDLNSALGGSNPP